MEGADAGGRVGPDVLADPLDLDEIVRRLEGDPRPVAEALLDQRNVAGIGTMLCGLWAWYYIRNVPREHPSVNEAEARYLEEAHAIEDAATPPSSGNSATS